MTRRDMISAATIPVALVAGGMAAAMAPPPTLPPHVGPGMYQLINLAEHGPRREYYGRLLAEALAETGRIANDNGDGTVSLYHAEMIREKNGGQSWAWRKDTVRGSGRNIPDDMLPRVRPENRGPEFPAGIPFKPMAR